MEKNITASSLFLLLYALVEILISKKIMTEEELNEKIKEIQEQLEKLSNPMGSC